MKKQRFIFFTVILFLIFLFSNCKNQTNNFKDYFDEEYSNYEFMIKNPLLSSNFFFTDLDTVKDKYLLKIYEYYSLDNKGRKYFSDGDTWDTIYSYYKFDKDGQIKTEYSIRINNLGKVTNQVISTYDYTKKKYIVTEIDLLQNEDEIITYNIKTEEEKLIFEYIDKYETLFQTIFEKGKRTDLEIWKGELENKSEQFYSKDTNIGRGYEIDKKTGIESVDTETIFKNGVIQKFVSKGVGVEIEKSYIIDSGSCGKFEYKETRGKDVVTFSHYLERRFNEAGFLEYEIQRPFKDGEPGDYTIKTAKILNEPDELLMKYFPEQIKGR